ncbi:MAG TPA: hypothetical protein VFR13_07605 [Jiangellaceae bacterium]|nr:hypothetical protein [Jiangellaceae bacterium]
MSEPPDTPAEILDLGPRPRSERAEPARSLPTLHLGGPPPSDDEDGPPSWWRWGALAIAVVVGLVAGVLVSNARHEAADVTAAEEEVRLVAGNPQITFIQAPAVDLSFPLYNAGPLDVVVLGARPEGWRNVDESDDLRPTTLRSGTWTNVLASVEARECEGPTPTVLELNVRTQAREQGAEVALPAGSVLREAQDLACDTNRAYQVGIGVERVQVLPSSPEVLVMRLYLRAFDPSLRFDLIGLRGSAAGFETVAATIPVSFEPGGRSPTQLDVTWGVVDCTVTELLGQVVFSAEVVDANGRTTNDRIVLSEEGIAALARFGVSRCE